MNKARYCLIILLTILPSLSRGQYFSILYDGDSSADMGNHIARNADGTLLFYGGGGYGPSNRFLFFTQHVTADGSQLLDKHVFTSPYYSYFRGYTGRFKSITGGYICGITAQSPTNHPNFFGLNQAILAKFTTLGDTLFLRSYTDTFRNSDQTLDCLEMPDGNCVLAGSRESITNADTTPAVLWKVNSNGNLLWERQYQWQLGHSTKVNSIQMLDNNRIVAGMSTSSIVWTSPVWSYYREEPKFLILDTSGSILHDTTYGNPYVGGAAVFKDINSGFFHYGLLDSLLNPTYPDEPANFPPYVAHLDSNFRIEWLTRFPTILGIGKDIWAVKQLHDSSYIVVGDFSNYPAKIAGWAAKISKSGSVVWDNIYENYPQADAYLEDVIETPEHNLVLIGGAKDNALPIWRQDDAWLLGIDSNGCQIIGCTPTPTVVEQIARKNAQPNIYPNPTRGVFTIESEQQATILLYDLQGQKLEAYKIGSGKTQLALPSHLSSGLYIAHVYRDNGTHEVVRLLYRP